MLHQLARDRFALAQPLFGADLHLAVKAALAGDVPAELFVDDPLAPQAALLILWNQRIFLAGAPGKTAFALAFTRLLTERFAPLATVEAPYDRTITYTPAAWEESLPSLFADIENGRAERCYFRLQLRQPAAQPVLPEGFRLRAIDEALVAETVLLHHQELLAEMCSEAPSVAYFLEHRFGSCLQYGQELVGWCLSEYTRADGCELGIETLEPFQRRGLATAAALATIAQAQARGISSIGWHCWKSNVASSNLAEKLGFEKIEDYPVWRCRFQPSSRP